jgi:hypothetical protein
LDKNPLSLSSTPRKALPIVYAASCVTGVTMGGFSPTALTQAAAPEFIPRNNGPLRKLNKHFARAE